MLIKNLGRQDYLLVWKKMQHFTNQRNADTEDELWITEHPQVFTQGISGNDKHLLCPTDIAIIKTDRGGQITYHGPGQVVIYCLINLVKTAIGIRKMVSFMQAAVIDLLASYNVYGYVKDKAPGVYVAEAKIAALGLKVRRGCTYHGLSFNVDMDLAPFKQINICGYKGLKAVQLSDLTDEEVSFSSVAYELSKNIIYYVSEYSNRNFKRRNKIC